MENVAARMLQGGLLPLGDEAPRGRQAARWAEFRAGVAFLAAAGIAVLCLSYRDLEPNNAAPRPRNGDYFASLAPEENTLDSPDGSRGFQLLQKAAAASVLQHEEPAGGQELAADGLRFRAKNGQVDFLSAGAARSEMQQYWQSLARRTKLENGGLLGGASAGDAKPAPAPHAGPLTAAEARRQLDNYWNDLGANDGVGAADKRPFESLRKARAVTRLAKKAAIKDPVKDSSMDEMERIWSSESKSKKQVRATAGASSKQVHHVVSLHAAAQTGSSVHKEDGGRAGRYTSLPMCDHCSLQHFTWPVWNHRVDHALRVAENIAQGSHWNKTLHHVTLAGDAGDSGADGAGQDDAGAAADESDADLKLEVESAMSSLRAAIAESKAEQVEQEADAHGEKSASLSAAQRTQCLSVCFSEVQSLVGYLAPHPHPAAANPATTESVAAAAPAVSATANVVKSAAPEAAAPKAARQSSGTPASADGAVTSAAPVAAATPDIGNVLGGGDSIEKAVDEVEEAVGDSEEAAGKTGGGGVAAAVGAAVAAVESDVAPKPAAASARAETAAHGGAHAAAAVKASGSAARKSAVGAKRVEAGHGGAAGVAAAQGGKGVEAGEGKDVRKLEDDALNDAAEAQEQVREGESELKHLKLVLAKAHKLNKERGGDGGDAASGGSGSGAKRKVARNTDSADVDDAADDIVGAHGGIDSGLAASDHEALDMKSVRSGKGVAGRAPARAARPTHVRAYAPDKYELADQQLIRNL